MSEINVTPMVDVMLVLLIIFMVSAPLMTVGVQVDLPQTKAKALEQDHDPLRVTVDSNGKVYLQDVETSVDDLVPKLKAMTARGAGADQAIYLSGDAKVNYGPVAEIVALLKDAGFRKATLVNLPK